MTGHNHHWNCTCGWCVNQGRSRGSSTTYRSPDRASAFPTYRSYVNPNASCPVCGAAVFFYQSSAGGRVFFDELGPPWPKHPCTSSDDTFVSARQPRVSDLPRVPAWKQLGWTPIELSRSRFVETWHVVSAKIIETGVYLDLLLEDPFTPPFSYAALFRAWDSHGYGLLSVLDLNAGFIQADERVYERRQYLAISRYAVMNKRVRASR